MKKHETYEEYCLDFSEEIQIKMEDLKNFIQKILPETTLEIKYGIPTFVQKGKNIIHFGAFKNHFGLYPGAEAVKIFEKKLQKYKTSKGAIQFPFTQDLPWDLIQEITEFRKNKI